MAKSLKDLVSAAKQEVKAVSVADAETWTDGKALVIDVRESKEYGARHLHDGGLTAWANAGRSVES
jgi:hypothetical protein